MTIQTAPKIYENADRGNEIYHGVSSFMRLPVIKEKKILAEYDAAVLGVPWEGPVTWGAYSGCELATKTIRDASQRYGGYLPEYGYDLFDHLSVCDNGDVPVVWGDTAKTQSSIYDRTKDLFNSGTIPIIFGGDHSITESVINALADSVDGSVGIVHLDAHMDNLVSFGPDKHARCSPLYRIYENPKIDASKIVHIGIRGPRNSAEQIQNANDVGATIITGHEVKTKGVDYTISKALEVVKDGTKAVYISVCSDILDIAFNPGGPTDLNGLSSYELSTILYEISRSGITGFDFVEIYPPSDPRNISSHTAAWMAIYTLSGIAAQKREG